MAQTKRLDRWWSASVVGGDPPLRVIANIENALDLPRGALFPDDDQPPDPHVRHVVETNFSVVEKIVQRHIRQGDGEGISLQAAVFAAMNVGAHIPEFFWMRAFGAVKNDSWARHNSRRRTEMDALAQRMRRYTPGAPQHDRADLADIVAARRLRREQFRSRKTRG